MIELIQLRLAEFTAELELVLSDVQDRSSVSGP
jgi:hypothetical protein